MFQAERLRQIEEYLSKSRNYLAHFFPVCLFAAGNWDAC